MTKVNITPEAMERLAKDCEASREVLKADNKFTIGQAVLLESANTLRAQAERIKELEGNLRVRDRLLPVAKHHARNDALREAADAIEPHDKADVKTGGILTIAQKAILDLIEGATNDR